MMDLLVIIIMFTFLVQSLRSKNKGCWGSNSLYFLFSCGVGK